jgi:hypothetical protein
MPSLILVHFRWIGYRRGRRLMNKEVVLREEPVLVSRVGLRIASAVDYETWVRAGLRIAETHDSSTWCLGDWLVYGQEHYEKRYGEAVEAIGLDYQTLRNYAWVARRFPLYRRRRCLSFQHHAEVAALPEREQDHWLSLAEQFGWSRNALRRNVRAAREAGGNVARSQVVQKIGATRVQIERWRLAAARSNRNLESWIVYQLDEAATRATGS